MFSKEVIKLQGKKYLTRYRLIEVGWLNIFIHIIHMSDKDVHLHDHPWSFVTILLKGRYLERLEKGKYCIGLPFVPRFRRAETKHRIRLISPAVVSLVIASKKYRQWGFYVPRTGWIHNKLYERLYHHE